MHKIIRVIFLISILFLLVNHSEAEYSNPDGLRKIEGFINQVDLESRKISVDNITYNLAGECLINLNDRGSSLPGLKPPIPGFYKWAEIYLDNEGMTVMISAYYKVVEGIIKDISHSDRSLLLLEFQNDSRSARNCKWYTLIGNSKESFFSSLEKSDHVILITARNRILTLY